MKQLRMLILALLMAAPLTASAQVEPGRIGAGLKKSFPQVQGSMRLPVVSGGSEPTVTGKGWLLYNDSTDALRVYDGSSWSDVAGGGGGSSAFNDITSGTNTTADMVVGSGATFSFTSDSLITSYLPLDAIADPAHAAGLLFYSTNSDELVFYNSDADVALNIGTELWVKARNVSGVDPIPDFRAVYLSGATGNRAQITQAQADAAATSHVIGITTHAIENNSNGFVTAYGTINGVDTDGSPYSETWNDGDTIYLSPTVAGGMTNVKPTGNNLIVKLGEVLTAGNNGSFHVHLVHPVDAGLTSSTDNAVVRFDGTSGARFQDSGITIDDSDVMTIPSSGGLVPEAAGTDSMKIGAITFGSGNETLIWGNAAHASNASNSVVIGNDITHGPGNYAVTIGYGASGGPGSVVLGSSATTDALGNSVALGWSADDNHGYTVVIGPLAQSTAQRQIVFGSASYYYTTMYVGEGENSASPQDFLFSGTNTTDGTSNVGTGDLTIAAGLPTGDASGGTASIGRIIFTTSDGVNPGSTTQHTAETVMSIGPQAIAGNPIVEVSETAEFYPKCLGGFDDCIYIGKDATGLMNGADTIVIGSEVATGNGARTVAIGTGTTYGSADDAVVIGNNAEAIQGLDVVIGAGASSALLRGIAIGSSADSDGTNSIAIGYNSGAGTTGSIVIGANSNATQADSITLGYSSDVTHANSIALGGDTASTATNQFIVGSSNHPITTAYIGEGVQSAAPDDLTFSGTNTTSGTSNVGTGDLTIAAGLPTGDATGGTTSIGVIKFTTSNGTNPGATTQHTATTVLQLGTTTAGTTPWVQSEVEIAFKELSGAPTAISGYGTIWTESDNLLHFMDGDGTEHTVTFGDSASFYFNGVSNAVDVTEASEDHGIAQATVDETDGDWAFEPGGNDATGGWTVTAVANDGGGNIRCTTSAPHGITAPSVVTITNTSDGTDLPNGVYRVDNVSDTTHFDLQGTTFQDVSATATAIEPSHLTAGAADVGDYDLRWDANQQGGATGGTYIMKVYQCDSSGTCAALGKATRERTTGNNNIGSYSGSTSVTIASGDKLFFTVQYAATNSDPIQKYGRLHLHRE